MSVQVYEGCLTRTGYGTVCGGRVAASPSFSLKIALPTLRRSASTVCRLLGRLGSLSDI